MANFLFYKYRFEQCSDSHLFSSDGEKISAELHNNRLAETFVKRKELDLYESKTNKKGEQFTEKYYNEVKRFDDGIALIQVRNNKIKKVIPKDQYESKNVEHYPFCWVIIDTRPDSHAILVQQKRDAFQNGDSVIDLVINFVNRELGLPLLNWNMVVEKRFCKGSIWDIVRARTNDGNDRVKSLSIKILEKRANDKNAVDNALQLILQKLAAPEGELRIATDDNAKKILDETNDDVRNTVDMLIENHYNMKIGFDKSGTVEYGKNADAIYGILDDYCVQFEDGARVIMNNGSTGYNLEVWLDTVIPEDEVHKYVKSENKKRNGRKSKN